jgi:hypothetical protein
MKFKEEISKYADGLLLFVRESIFHVVTTHHH